MVFVCGILGEERTVYARRGEGWPAQSGRNREEHDLNGVIPVLLAAARTLRVGVREAREGCDADLVLGAIKDAGLLAFLAEHLCRGKTLDHVHRSLATRTPPEVRIGCEICRCNARHMRQ